MVNNNKNQNNNKQNQNNNKQNQNNSNIDLNISPHNQDNLWIRVGRPGAVGSRKKDIINSLNQVYGKDQWKFAWDVNNRILNLEEELLIYDQAYDSYFQKHPDELEWIANNFANVYDNNISNICSGCDYSIQEFEGNHFQDIAIRRALTRRGMWFKGEGLLEIRTSGEGKKWGPGEIPFQNLNLIMQPEINGWWKAHSIEAQYQSNKVLIAKNNGNLESANLYFVTGNNGKVKSANISLPQYKIAQVKLPISENLESECEIAEHKAKVGRAVLCKPVIADDSGFVICDAGNYPGRFVGRELKNKGINHFLEFARRNNKETKCYFVQALSYFSPNLTAPKTFLSYSHGTLIGEIRGDLNQEHIKSDLFGCFIPKYSNKTLAEMGEEEYLAQKSDRWEKLRNYLNQ